MTSPNVKLTASLNRSLQRIANDEFDEFDIKLLLIDIREYLREETFLREVADFVAHPERERGVCYKAINARYAKMKMAAAGVQKLAASGSFTGQSAKPNNFYTDQILNYISLPRIGKADYQLFVLDCLDDLTDDILVKYYNLNKRDIQQLLHNSFTKDAGFYCLKPTLSIQDIYRLDDILKFLRGTVLGIGVISYDGLQQEFNKALKRIASALNLTTFHSKLFRQQFDGIFVCILALLHDAMFKLYDGTEARAYLALHSDRAAPHQPPTLSYTLTLMAKTPSLSFPLITSDIMYTRFIDETGIQPADFDLQPIPWIHTQRSGNQLRLQRSSDLP